MTDNERSVRQPDPRLAPANATHLRRTDPVCISDYWKRPRIVTDGSHLILSEYGSDVGGAANGAVSALVAHVLYVPVLRASHQMAGRGACGDIAQVADAQPHWNRAVSKYIGDDMNTPLLPTTEACATVAVGRKAPLPDHALSEVRTVLRSRHSRTVRMDEVQSERIRLSHVCSSLAGHAPGLRQQSLEPFIKQPSMVLY